MRHGTVKADGRLNDGESFRGSFHLAHVFCIIFWVVTLHGKTHAAIVHTHFVADLAPEKFVYWQAGSLTSNIPQSHLDGADSAAPRLEAPHAANLHHHSFDIGRVFANQILFIEKHMRFEIRFGVLSLTVAINPFIGVDADNRILTDDRTFKISD